MDRVTLRRAGGSLTLTIPRHLVRELGLSEGAAVGVSAEDGRLIARPMSGDAPAYKLEDLLAQCDPSAPLTDEDDVWLRDGALGDEVI